MKKVTGITAAVLLCAGITVGGYMALGDNDGAKAASSDIEAAAQPESLEIAQAAARPAAVEATAPATAPSAPAALADNAATETSGIVTADDAALAPETTEVSGHLVLPDGKSAADGVVYFVFQNRLNEVPHTDSVDKIKNMVEAAAEVDEEGSFTLKMKPGNFAMLYDPAAVEAPSQPGPESMSVVRKLSRDQVQSRIAAIKENAMQGLPISDGKIGDAYIVENRFVRPPISNFGDIQLQNDGVVTVKAVDDKGEPINFPATLRLRGKNGDIMEPHTPSVSKRAQYSFHDIMPQSYQVFALGTLPRPGAGDELTTPTVSNDQFVYTGEPLDHEVVVEQPAEKSR